MSYSKFIARLVTERRGLVWLAVALIAALSLYVLVTRLTLDTEVLDLLPGEIRIGPGTQGLQQRFRPDPRADFRARLPA